MNDQARKPIDIPVPRPLSEDGRKRDLMRLISEDRSLLDPPPATSAPNARFGLSTSTQTTKNVFGAFETP